MSSESATVSPAVEALIARALHQGITQVTAVGSPLHPLLFDDSEKMYILYDGGKGADPMAMALQAIRTNTPDTTIAALVIDTRLTFTDGKTWDAITVMIVERGEETGTMWAQRYVPKGLFRKFRTEGEPEEVGTIRDFITAALTED